MLIGVYVCNQNPYLALGKKQANELSAAAKLKGATAIFFDSSGVNFEKEMVKGLVRKKGVWNFEELSFPNVLINPIPYPQKKRSQTEEKLLKRIPSTTRLIEDKYIVFEKIIKEGKYAKHILPYRLIKSKQEVFDFLNDHRKIVLKPKGGRQGTGVYFLRREKEKYFLHDHTKMHSLSREGLEKSANHFVHGEFFAQPLIDCRNKRNIPYDFRIHVQKNGRGEWIINTGYARIGTQESIVTNISQGGSMCDINVKDFIRSCEKK